MRALIQSLDLSEYTIGDILGVGTVGTIYAAQRHLDGQSVAIKRLHPGVSNDPNIRARFEREMTILQRLRHPNIIRYDGGGEAEGKLFYVMELVDGGTVKELLEESGQIAWPIVVELTRQICSALQCAHNHGVIHRDLKPGNLFLSRKGDLKLGDFGIARDLNNADLTSTGMTVGTHAYMAPEQITADQRISGKADLYALGCCIFEMLTGRKVFDGENFAQLFEQHLRAKPLSVRSLVPTCPPELDNIVMQLLAKEPEDRPFNARSVQGIMIQLEADRMKSFQDEGPRKTSSTSSPPDSKPVASLEGSIDVSAESVDGRVMLQQQIEARLDATRPQVSWRRLTAVLVVVAAVIGLAKWMGN